MLTDAILKEATGALVEFRLSAVAEEREYHHFSDGFEQKMKKLLRRAEHPLAYRALRAAAVIAIVLTTLFGVVFAASPEVRAEVVNWIRSTFSGGISYVADGNNAEQAPYDYRLSAVPSGYEQLNVVDSSGSKHYSYANEDGEILKFAYKYPVGSGGMDIHGNYEAGTVYVDGIPAELYLSPDGSEANVIVWRDPETEAILWIKAWEPAEKLIELAQTVEKVRK